MAAAPALRFAEQGAKVVVAARGEPGLRSLVAEIEAAGGTATAVVADVTDPAQVHAVADRAVAEHGRLDTWLVDALLRRIGYELHDTGEREPANAPDNLDAPLTANDTVDGTVGRVTLRHSAYTWWAIHKPVRTTGRALARPGTALSTRRGSDGASPVLTAVRWASRPTAAGRAE